MNATWTKKGKDNSRSAKKLETTKFSGAKKTRQM